MYEYEIPLLLHGHCVNIAGAPYATIEKLTLLSINAMKLNVNK